MEHSEEIYLFTGQEPITDWLFWKIRIHGQEDSS